MLRPTAGSPAALGFSMPPEWATHARTWMAWPSRPATWHGRMEAARAAHAQLAMTIQRFEPVTIVCNPGDVAEASIMCGPGVELAPMPLSDGWMRDIGPTFLRGEEEIAGVDWRFDGWGGLHRDWTPDAEIASRILELRGYRRFATDLVLEGGAVNGDGAGTLLVTEQCLLQRNPGWSREAIERTLCDLLGARRVIWLGQGYDGDETQGHIDEIACFVGPGRVLFQCADDPADANFAIQADNRARLDAARTADGRAIEVVSLPQPEARLDHGRRLTLSYVNFAFANGAVVIPSFGDPADAAAVRVFSGLFPDRRVVQVAADDIVVGGGGIHCVTQQEPLGLRPPTR